MYHVVYNMSHVLCKYRAYFNVARYWSERSEPHTCGENGKLSISMYSGTPQRTPLGTNISSVIARCPVNVATLTVQSDHQLAIHEWTLCLPPSKYP